MELTAGIDLAAQNAKTAACVIEWHADRAVARPPVAAGKGEDDDWLVDLVGEATATGIDAPFGWPEAFVRALPAWADGGRWSVADKADLRFRTTDRRVADRVSRTPLSVSSDRIAITAWRCARLLDRLRPADGRPVSRTGDDGIFEVYPGAALACWGFKRAGYKTSGSTDAKVRQRGARAALIGEIQSRAPWLELDSVAQACEASDDVLDAVIAAMVTRAAAKGLTEPPEAAGAEVRRRIEREGWIHLPIAPNTLESLLAG